MFEVGHVVYRVYQCRTEKKYIVNITFPNCRFYDAVALQCEFASKTAVLNLTILVSCYLKILMPIQCTERNSGALCGDALVC